MSKNKKCRNWTGKCRKTPRNPVFLIEKPWDSLKQTTTENCFKNVKEEKLSCRTIFSIKEEDSLFTEMINDPTILAEIYESM